MAQLGHAIKIDEKREEDVVCRWTVFEYAEEVGFESDSGDISCVEGEG